MLALTENPWREAQPLTYGCSCMSSAMATWIPSCTGIDQSPQRFDELRLFGLAAFTTAAGTVLSVRRWRARIIELDHPISNGSIRQSGCSRYRFDSTPTEPPRLRRSPPPSSALVEVSDDRTVFLTNPFDHSCIRHGPETSSKMPRPSRPISVTYSRVRLNTASSLPCARRCNARMKSWPS